MIYKLNDLLIKYSIDFFQLSYAKLLPRKHYLKELTYSSSELSSDELKYLYIYIFLERDTILVEQCDDVMARLYVKGITERRINDLNNNKTHVYSLNSWARDYFLDNKQIFKEACVYGSLDDRKRLRSFS